MFDCLVDVVLIFIGKVSTSPDPSSIKQFLIPLLRVFVKLKIIIFSIYYLLIPEKSSGGNLKEIS